MGNVVTEAVGSPLTRANTQFGELHGAANVGPYNYFSTPNVVTTWPELDLRARATVDSFQNGYAFFADKAASFFLALRPSGSTQTLSLRVWPTAGAAVDYNSVAFPISQLGVRNWYRGTYDAATGDVKFFTADGNLEAPTISDYVQLGTTQNSGAAAIAVTTNFFTAGYFSSFYPFNGDIYRAQVFNEIDGTTPVVDFDFGDYVSGSTWTGIPYGPDVVINGDFATDTDWTKYAAWTISGGSANCNQTTGGSSFLYQSAVVAGQTYEFTYTVSNYVAGDINSRLGSINGPVVSANGTYTDIITSNGTELWLRGTNLFVGSIDNVSVRNIPLFTLEGNASVFQPPVDASGPFGYLAEKASTNLVLQSEDFTTSWTASYVTVVANAAVAPDGTTTMDKIEETANTGSHMVYQTRTGGGGVPYTFSAYIKAGERGFAMLLLNDYGSGGAGQLKAIFNLSTGAVGTVSAGLPTAVEELPNGIYRCSIAFTPLSSTGWNTQIGAAISSSSENYLGETGKGVYIWGAQVELGTYPTSYIPTTTTAVTRNADVLIAGDMVTDAAGSGYAEASSIWSTSPVNNFVLARTGAGRLIYAGSAQVSTGVRVYDGTTEVFSPVGASYQYLPASVASTWGAELIAYKDGVGGTASSYNGTMSSGNLGIGASNTGASQWDGTVREVKIFDSELTAAEVGDL